jgi:predicted kinase
MKKTLNEFFRAISEAKTGIVEKTHFKAIFVTGGPGSGKDIVIREAIAQGTYTELNTVQAFNYLADKKKLSEKSSDIRRESVRNRETLVINGPADDYERMIYIKEELEELGYEIMPIFVQVSNEASKERNEKLTRNISESVRFEKWQKSKLVLEEFIYTWGANTIVFENDLEIEQIKEELKHLRRKIFEFVQDRQWYMKNETAFNWLESRNKLDINESFNYFVEKETLNEGTKRLDSKHIQIKTTGKYNPGLVADTGTTPDNRAGGNGIGKGDEIKGNTFPRKNPNGTTVAGGSGAGAYATTEETKPTLKIAGAPKIKNFNKDAEIEKIRKGFKGGNPVTGGPNTLGNGTGDTFSSRSGLQMGLGEHTFSAFRKQAESIDSPGENAWGVSGNATGGMDKEGMRTYKDKDQIEKMSPTVKNKNKKKLGVV